MPLMRVQMLSVSMLKAPNLVQVLYSVLYRKDCSTAGGHNSGIQPVLCHHHLLWKHYIICTMKKKQDKNLEWTSRFAMCFDVLVVAEQ